ncbi:MAG: restriction endonuclease [Hyphomicrobium sp.]|nr:restriction endonuclease [Hyphomicrobium sp.]
MPTLHLVPKDIAELYEVHEWRNAAGVLSTSRPTEWQEVLETLRLFRLYRSEIVSPGGSKSKIANRFDAELKQRGWVEKQFKTAIELDGKRLDSPTHKIDCYKNHVALEVEWNNKDPFYDRDLNNFRLLFDLRAIEVGIIITRCSHLQEIFNALGRGPSYGNSTTHMDKLLTRIDGGAGGGCPVLVFGISKELYIEDEAGQIEVTASEGSDD